MDNKDLDKLLKENVTTNELNTVLIKVLNEISESLKQLVKAIAFK